MKIVELDKTAGFNPSGMKTYVLHESEFFKILNFNIRAGSTFPVHSHEVEGELTIHVVEGNGEFLGGGDKALPAKTGDLLISRIAEPHGIRAETDMRIVVTIAPPL